MQSGLNWWRRALLIAGLIWALVVIVPDLYRLVWPLGSFGFTVNNNGLVVAVDPDGPAAKAALSGLGRPLRPRDAIDVSAAPCLSLLSPPCRDFLAVFGGMGGLSYVGSGVAASLPVRPYFNRTTDPAEAGAVAASRISVTAADQPLDVLTKVFLLLDEIAGVYIVAQSFLLAWTRPSGMTFGFFLYAMWFNPGQDFAWYALLQRSSLASLAQEFLQAVAVGAAYGGFLWFSLRFPNDETEPRYRWMLRFAAPVGVAMALLQFCAFANVFGWRTETISRVAFLAGIVIDAAALAIIARRRLDQHPQDYQRMRWAMWGCLIGLPTFILADSYEATTFWTHYVVRRPIPEWAPEFLYLVSGVLAGFICEAIRTRRVANVSREIQEGAWYAALLFLSAMIHIAIERLYETSLAHFADILGSREVVSFGVLILSSLLSLLITGLAERGARHLLDRDRLNAFGHLLDAGASLREASVFGDVDHILVRAPEQHLRLSSAALFRNVEGRFQLCGPVCGWDPVGCDALTSEADLAAIGKLDGQKAMRFSDAGFHLGGFSDESSRPALAVPIGVGKSIYAIAFYGPHETGADLDRGEREVLERFCEQAAVGYEHAELLALRRQRQGRPDGELAGAFA